MASTTFSDKETVIEADWLNEVDALLWDVFGGASDDATARTNLGLDDMAIQSAASVAITGGTISGVAITATSLSTASATITGGSVSGITDLAVADGGTGASTASDARTNLGAAASATTITAGDGLSGGGDLSANRTLALDINGLTAESTIDTDNDYLAVYDSSAAAPRKTVISNILGTLESQQYTSHISGLLWENNSTDATNDFDVSAGSCWSADGTTFLELSAAQTKRMDASWTSGDNGGALATGATAWSTGNTTYFIFIGLSGGNVEIVADSSVTAANAIANHGFSKVRRIGAFYATTASTMPTLHNSLVGGDIESVIDVPVRDIAISLLPASPTVASLTVPRGIEVLARFVVSFDAASGDTFGVVTETRQSASTPSPTLFHFRVAAGTFADQELVRMTDTSGQIRYEFSTARSCIMDVFTVAYADRRTQV